MILTGHAGIEKDEAEVFVLVLRALFIHYKEKEEAESKQR